MTRFMRNILRTNRFFLPDCKDTRTLNVSQFFFYHPSQKIVKGLMKKNKSIDFKAK
jgi:hypothetical protein